MWRNVNEKTVRFLGERSIGYGEINECDCISHCHKNCSSHYPVPGNCSCETSNV